MYIRGENFSDIQLNFKFSCLNKCSLLIVQAITGKIYILWLSRRKEFTFLNIKNKTLGSFPKPFVMVSLDECINHGE